MDNGYPSWPRLGDIVKFNLRWSFYDSDDKFQEIEPGTLGQILDTSIGKDYSHDTASYIVFIGITTKGKGLHVLKITYTERPDVITVIPNTPAAQVLFGKKNEQT